MEDEPLLTMMLEQMVAELGHTVSGTVRSAKAALAELLREPPNVVLLDINLGGELSHEVANHCTVSGVPVVLTTGYGAADLPDGLKHCSVLQKPFSLDQLQSTLEPVVRSQHSGRGTQEPR